MQTPVQHNEGYTTVRTTHGPAQSLKAQVTTRATTQSAQPRESQSNTTVRTKYRPAHFSTAQTATSRATQPAQFREAKDNMASRTRKNPTQLSEAKVDTSVGMTTKGTSKPVIYLTQTEKCLPQNLNEIGDENTFNCDVIVLCYRTLCQEDNRTHISYIFVGEGSWTVGRNIVYSIARERLPGYHYYILLDDDVELRFNSLTPHEMKVVSPFRAFEAWLLDYEPAVGVVDQQHRPQNAISILQKKPNEMWY